ncbi:MAG: DNA primase [Haloquadratum phage sp.]|nr:MAG: DNA primase [Haloquadratum phage sp.]
MVTVNADNIPTTFKQNTRWLLWDNSASTPRRPHWKGDFGVGWSDSDDWHSFEEALAASQEQDSWGVGYVIQPDDPEYIIDIDGPYADDGTKRDWVPDLDQFTAAGAYAEWSPSGNGIHVTGTGEIPDWWSDSEIAPDVHEGVDVLKNKFCTFTGDKLDQAGSAVVEVDPSQFLFEAYYNIEGESPRLETENTISYESDRFDRSDIEAALNTISPDLPHNEWIKIGYAVHDWDAGSTGKSVFESWSRQSDKWDANAQRSIDNIWSSASQGNGVTVGTLVYKATNNGWETPSVDPSEIEDADSDDIWQYVRAMYAEETNKDGRLMAASALESETDWMYVMDSDTLWVYDDSKGYFNPWGEQYAAKLLERNLQNHYSKTEKQEVIDRLHQRNQTRRKELNARDRDSALLCVGNGVVNLETGDLRDHSPKYNFTRGLAWDYRPAEADTEPILEFLDDITKREADRDTILDHLGHGLMPGHPYRAFLIMYGPGSNGKTRVGKLLRGFVGEENAASVELQDLTGDDNFATGGLPGAFVNIGDDISVSEIRDTSIIKSLTGDGTVRANEKFEKQFEFENEAAMFFSANEPPRIREQTQAISDRLYPIEMPYRFVDDPREDSERQKKKVPGIAKQLLSNDAAMRGLLKLAVEHARDVIERNGQYSMPEGPAERRELYESASDPIKRFALTHMQQAAGSDVVLKEDAYTIYKHMCDEENARAASEDVFKQQVGSIATLDVESTRTRKLTPGESRDRAWKFVTFAESAKQYMPGRIEYRYFGDRDESVDEPEMPETDLNATRLQNAAETLTGYVTVTAEVVKVDTFGQDTTKAILKDTSGAMDFMTWDAGIRDRLEELESQTVMIQDAEVGEHDGTRQLQVIDGLTELERIEPGTGYTEAETDDTSEAGTAADGGTEAIEGPPDDATGRKPNAQRIAKVMKREGVTDQSDALKPPAIAAKMSMNPDSAEAALEYGASEMNPALFARQAGEYWLLDHWT